MIGRAPERPKAGGGAYVTVVAGDAGGIFRTESGDYVHPDDGHPLNPVSVEGADAVLVLPLGASLAKGTVWLCEPASETMKIVTDAEVKDELAR